MKPNHSPESHDSDRPLKPALWKGALCKCPSCGAGPLFNGYLTVRPSCSVCNEDFTPQRADDGPAWATIMITGHLMAPLLLVVYEMFRPEPWVMAVSFSLVFVLLSLFLLPRLKGMFIAFQWAKRMHGFGTTPKAHMVQEP